MELTLPDSSVPEGAPLSWRLQEAVHRIDDSDGFTTQVRATGPARPEAREEPAVESKVTFSPIAYRDPNRDYARLVEGPSRDLERAAELARTQSGSSE